MNDQKQHDPRDRPVGARAVRLDAICRTPISRPPTSRRPRSSRARTSPLPKPAADPAADSPAAIRDRAVVMAETPRVAIQTPRLQGSINLRGARIDDLVLTDHREGLAKTSPPVRLLSPGGARRRLFRRASAGPAKAWPSPAPSTVWTASGTRLTPATPVTLSWTNGQGQSFDIKLSVDDELHVHRRAELSATRGAGAVAARPYLADQPRERIEGPGQLDDACRPGRRVRRRRQLRHRL